MTAAASSEVPAIEIFDPMDPGTLKEPYAAYRILRERYPVAYLEPLSIWVVSQHHDARSVLTDPEAFSAALAFGKDASITDSRSLPRRQLNLKFAGDSAEAVSSSDGDAHVRLRRLVAKLLSKPRLDAADGEIRDHARRVISALAAERREFDVVCDLARPIAAAAIGGVMGLSDDLIRVLASWVDLTSCALDPGNELSLLAARPRILRSNLACVRAVTTFLKSAPQQAAGPPGGLVERWLEAVTPASREEVVLSILQLFQAGYETIVSAICYILAAIVADQPRSLAYPTSPGALAGLIDEGLRLASPVRATFRTAVGTQMVGRVPVPDQAMVMVLLGSANRDERVFSDPGQARLDRPVTHMAFGSGPHRCLGRFLAHMELRHILGILASASTRISAVEGARVSANILKASYDYLPVSVEWR